MLKGIRDMINRKQSFSEAAKVIFEDAVDSALDDLIILEKEEPAAEEPVVEEEGAEEESLEKDEKKPDENPEDISLEDEEEPEDDDDEEDDDLTDIPLDGGEEIPEDDLGADLTDTPLDGDSGDDSLPTPIGAQTGEPVADNIDDIMQVSLDLKSNTLADLLPIPPSNAADAIIGDTGIMNTRIDSGFGEEEEPPAAPGGTEGPAVGIPPAKSETEDGDLNDIPLDGAPAMESKDSKKEDIKDVPLDSGLSKPKDEDNLPKKFESTDFMDTPLTEAITLGGEETPPAEAPPADAATPDANMNAGGTENEVTSAVRNKVAEADTGLDDPTGLDLGDGALTGSKDEIQDRLDKMNMDIMKTKELIKQQG